MWFVTLNLGGHQGVALRRASVILYDCVTLACNPVLVPWCVLMTLSVSVHL